MYITLYYYVQQRAKGALAKGGVVRVNRRPSEGGRQHNDGSTDIVAPIAQLAEGSALRCRRSAVRILDWAGYG